MAVDPAVAASSARTLEAVWRASLESRQSAVRLLEAFGNTALGLCALGVYGVAACAARTRRRELAIRAALGARRSDLMRAMFRQELPPLLAGLAVGVAIAVGAAPRLFADAFAISPRDAGTYIAAVATLFFVAVLSVYVPVRRAGGADPADALAP